MDFGFKFSSYIGEHHHAGLNQSDLPQLISIKDGQVLKVGKTVLTDEELKQVILRRKVTVSRFLDNGDCWHCFFVTYASLRGQETWNDGQPHFHYISDKFGIPKDKVITTLKSAKYKLGSLPHLDYIDIN